MDDAIITEEEEDDEEEGEVGSMMASSDDDEVETEMTNKGTWPTSCPSTHACMLEHQTVVKGKEECEGLFPFPPFVLLMLSYGHLGIRYSTVTYHCNGC